MLTTLKLSFRILIVSMVSMIGIILICPQSVYAEPPITDTAEQDLLQAAQAYEDSTERTNYELYLAIFSKQAYQASINNLTTSIDAFVFRNTYAKTTLAQSTAAKNVLASNTYQNVSKTKLFPKINLSGSLARKEYFSTKQATWLKEQIIKAELEISYTAASIKDLTTQRISQEELLLSTEKQISLLQEKLSNGYSTYSSFPPERPPPGPSKTAVAAYIALGRITTSGLEVESLQKLATAIGDPSLVPLWVSTPVPTIRAVLLALSQVGKPYVYATAGPTTYDCSGLTKRAWTEAGISIPHFSGAQLAVGMAVPPANLIPGDLLAYGSSGKDHVTMYIGNGLVVEAKGKDYGVVVSPMNINVAKGFAGASRVG